MGEIVEFKPRQIIIDDGLGGCPHCGQNDGFLNVERDHWVICHQHQAKWLCGSNLFSGWRREDEGIWQRNRFKLFEYMTVEPIFPKPTEAERCQAEEDTDLWRRIDKGHGVACGPDGPRALESGEDDIPW